MQMPNFQSIRLRLITLTTTSVVLTAGLGFYSGTTLSDFNRSTAALVAAGHAMRNHMEADMMHDAVRADVLSVLAARTPDERKRVQTDLEEHLEVFRDALSRNERMELPGEIKGALAAIKPELSHYAESAKDIFKVAETDRAAAERRYPQFLEAFESLEGKNAAASNLIQLAADKTEEAQKREYASGLQAILFVIIGVAVASLAASWMVARGIARALAELDRLLAQTSGSLTTASAEVAAASGAIAEGASFQAQSVTEAADSSAQASLAAQANAGQCRDSVALIEQLVDQASGSQSAAKQLNQAMDALRQSSSRISGIVKEIEEIAFQTNLLALNASVEAARAGEAGAGFAVVAGEVGNLAQRATAAARETAQLIQESCRLSGQGAERARMVGDSIGTLMDAFEQVRKSIDVINAASREQSSTIGQISASVAKIQDVTQRNAANAEQNAAVSRELEGQAKSLDKVVDQLRALAQ